MGHPGVDTTPIAAQLLARYHLVSNQVTPEQVATVLHELHRVLLRGTPGAIVEFGCYIGTTSLFLRRLIDAHTAWQDRELHVYDSFVGLPAKSAADSSAAGEAFQPGQLQASKKQLLREFHKAALRPPIVHKGWFSDLGAEQVPDRIAFAFLDGDFYESIADSLRLVLPRLQPGGTIVVDDYAREALPGVARAVRQHVPPELFARVLCSHNLGIVRN